MDHLVYFAVAVLAFFLLYWLINQITALPPGPVPPRTMLRMVLLVLLGLFALSFLLGEAGLWGTWGYGYHGPVFHR